MAILALTFWSGFVIFGLEGLFGPILLKDEPSTAVRAIAGLWLMVWIGSGINGGREFFRQTLCTLVLEGGEDGLEVKRTSFLGESSTVHPWDRISGFTYSVRDDGNPSSELYIMMQDGLVKLETGISMRNAEWASNKLNEWMDQWKK